MEGRGSWPCRNLSLLDLLLKGCLKEPQEQVFLTLVGGIVVESEDHRVHELGGLVLGHLKDQLRQVGGVGLKHKHKVISM